ncbi:choloylglycine hydrolase family protein [Acetobacterium woodii]|nr:choloylglycine hydrolase family protein [Acetobacterium woodii]
MCTSLTLSTSNQLNILARTMDFATILDPDLVFVPRKYPLASQVDEIKRPANYAIMGMGQKTAPAILTDGLNEVGLACATLYFPDYAHYSDQIDATKTNLAPLEVVAWLLSNFATLDEVKAAVMQLNLISDPAEIFTPLHWIVTDKTGHVIVVEPMKNGIVIHDNPLGVMANSPDLNWHLTNIRNYIGVNPNKLGPIKLNGVTFSPFGNGARTFGLPGDYTPPSRFLRAVFGKEAINVLENEDEGIKAAFHILSSVEIPKGSVFTDEGVDYTQYTAAMVCNTGTYYFKTYDNNQIIKACIFDKDLDSEQPKAWKIPQIQQYGTLNE